MNKKIGGWSIAGAKVNFSYLLPYLNKALQYLTEWEQEEYKLIKLFYEELDTVEYWQVVLSDWKVEHDVHRITEYQTKRFAKYLGNVKE